MNLQQFLEEEKRSFEENFLDGDTMEDCGKCVLRIDEDYIAHYKDHDTRLINKVLDEVKREVEKKAGEGTLVSINDISTIIDNLRVK